MYEKITTAVWRRGFACYDSIPASCWRESWCVRSPGRFSSHKAVLLGGRLGEVRGRPVGSVVSSYNARQGKGVECLTIK